MQHLAKDMGGVVEIPSLKGNMTIHLDNRPRIERSGVDMLDCLFEQ